MNISLVGRHVELTPSIKEHLNSSIESLEKFNLDIISVNAVASLQEKKGTSIEFSINLAGKNTIIIKQRDDDLYAAIDIAIDRAQKALRRLSDRKSDHRNESINSAKNETQTNINLAQEREDLEDEVVPHELELYKPQEVGDVLETLKESDKIFEIFIDHEDKTRVLYKRSDGRFGLY